MTAASPKRSARQRILATASELFYYDGIHATGVDTIAARAGVTKMTLYRHFASKDALIVAYLEKANAEFMTWLEAAIEPHAGAPRQQIIALFEATAKLASTPHCHGCAFQNTAVEFPELEHAGHQTAIAHKRAVHGRLRDLARAAGARDADRLADQLLLLMDGAWIAKRMFGPHNPARNLAGAATALVDAELAKPKRVVRAAGKGSRKLSQG